jgi:hypothetical protein
MNNRLGVSSAFGFTLERLAAFLGCLALHAPSHGGSLDSANLKRTVEKSYPVQHWMMKTKKERARSDEKEIVLVRC